MVPVGSHYRFQERAPRLRLFNLIHKEHVHIHILDVRGQSLPHLGIVDPHQGGIGEGATPEGIEHLRGVLHVEAHMEAAVPFPALTPSQGVDHSGIIQGHFEKTAKRHFPKPALFVVIHEESPIPGLGVVPIIFNNLVYVHTLNSV